MSNCKQISICGTLPFDLGFGDHPNESMELHYQLAFTLRPTVYVKLVWDLVPTYVTNQHGGKTAMFRFHLTGLEAVSWDWIDRVKALVEAVGGSIQSDMTLDVEG